MSREKENLDQLFARPFPKFLETLKTDAHSAATEFAEHARAWLLAHPTPCMSEKCAEEQQEIVDDTIERCLRKEAEPLRNYTDAWGSFGAWLTSVAEDTCAARARQRQSKKEVAWIHEEAVTQSPAPKPTPPKKTQPKRKAPHAPTPHPHCYDKPGRPVRAFFAWIASPRIFIPVLLIVVAIFLIRGTRQPSQHPTRSYTPQPIDAVLKSESEVRRDSFEVLPLPLLPEISVKPERTPVTAVFREDRPVVLELNVGTTLSASTQAVVSILDKSGSVVWSQTLEAEYSDSGFVYLQIKPMTFAPNDYEVLVTHSDVLVAHSAFLVR